MRVGAGVAHSVTTLFIKIHKNIQSTLALRETKEAELRRTLVGRISRALKRNNTLDLFKHVGENIHLICKDSYKC